MFWHSKKDTTTTSDLSSSPSPLTAFGGGSPPQSLHSSTSRHHVTPSTPSTTTASTSSPPQKLSVVNASTFFQQHPLTPPPLPPNLDYDFDSPSPAPPQAAKTARHISRRRGTEQPKGVTERHSDEKRRASDFRGPAPVTVAARRSPRTSTKEPPLLTQSASPVVKQLQPTNEVYMLPTTRTTTGGGTRTARTGSPRSMIQQPTSKPHPDYQERMLRLQSSPDKYRDEVVAELFSEVKRVPVGGLTSRRRSFEPNRDTAMTAATVAALLDTVNTELDRPLKDVTGALRDCDAAMERSVDIAHKATKSQSDSAPYLISSVAKVSRKKQYVTAKGAQGRSKAASAAVDTGVTKLMAQALSPRFVTMMPPEFAADALAILSNGLACQATRAATRECVMEVKVPETAENIVKDPRSISEARQAATEFGVHFAENPADREFLAKNHPALLAEEETITLPMMMRVVRRKVGAGKTGDGGSTTTIPTLGRVQVSKPNKRDRADTDGSDDLAEIIARFENPQTLRDPEAAGAFAELASTYAAKRRAAKVVGAGGHELLLKLLKIHADDPLVVGGILDAFSYLCEDDTFMQFFTADNVPPVVKAHSIIDDPDCVYKYVDLLEDLVVFGTDEARGKIAKAKVLSDLDLIEEKAEPEEVPLLISIGDIRKCLVPEENPLTLKEVYSILMSRQYNDESLNIVEERSVKRLFNFVRKKVREYGAEGPIPDGVFGFTASELMYGCMSFQLLASVEDNHALFKQYDIPQLMLDVMRTQPDEQIAQHAVLTAAELAQHETLVKLFVDSDEKKTLIVQMLKRGRKAVENDVYNDVEDLVAPRVQLIERTAVQRDTYSGTDAVQQLVETWDDYEYYFFGNIRVKNRHDLNTIFKADRKDKRKAKMAKRLHRGHDHHHSPHEGAAGLVSGESSKRRKSIVNKIIRRKDTDEDRHQQRPSVMSPLERRKSIVGGQQPPATPSPLERRKSVVPGAANARRQSLGNALPLTKTESQHPGLMRRASQFFGGNKQESPQQPTGVLGVGGTIAQARQAASGNAPLQRRGSFFARGSPAAAPAVMPNSPDKRRASLLQRRASMSPPVADLSHVPQRKMTRKSSAASSVYDGHTVNGSFKSGRSFGSESRWSDFDFEGVDLGDQFVPHMLEHVFKALRRTVGNTEIATLRKANVPMRLVGLIADQETPPAAFPDILYLIGMLAGTDKTLKEEFGDYKAVEKACSLLKRAYRQQGAYVSEVVTNACLCLATLCVVHLPNTRRFEKKKGPQLTVDALRARGDYNDTQAVNAASALICNLCYKNEAMKSVLGEAGASEALVRAMAKYESTGSKADGTRCISSLFKAIGNLSLNQKNMEKLMASDVEIAYSSFLGQVDGELDDSTLEAALRTLSNLVIEKDNMERFAPVVVPFLSMLRRERTTSTDVHRWAFMTLAGLCRRPKNAQSFCENDGVRTVMKVVPYLEQTPGLRASIICLLGIQTTHPPNVKVLVDNGVFYVIAETLKEFLQMLEKKPEIADAFSSTHISAADGFDQQTSDILAFSQLPISSLRCAHRCLTHKEAAQECIKEGVFELAQKVMLKSSFQPMLTYETLRVIFGCMNLVDPDRFSRRSDFPFLNNVVVGHKDKGVDTFNEVLHEWGNAELEALQDGEDPTPKEPPYVDPTEPEWLLTLGDHVRRPHGRRIWEELNMTPNMMQMCETIRKIASNEKAQRNVRLQRCALGALAWISCERVCAPSFFRRLHIPIDPDLHCPADDGEEEVESVAAPPPLQRRKSIWESLKRDKTQVHISVDEPPSSTLVDHSYSKAPPPIARRKSVWDAFKRDKTEARLERKTGFGRQRKADATSIVDLVRRTLQNLWFDCDCIDLVMILLNNCIWMCFGHQDLAPLLAEVELYKELKSFIDRNEEKVKAYWLFTLRNYKRFMQTQGKFHPIDDCSDFSDISHFSRSPVGTIKSSRTQMDIPGIPRRQYLTGEDLGLMHALALTSFPMDLTQWDIDPFPDGVQSLPPETRKKLRSGGKCEYIDVTGKRNYFYYKSSHDLVLFEWKIVPLDAKNKEIDPQYPHALAISRFYAMNAGVDHANFHRGMQFDRGISESKCCLLRGPAIASLPEGVTLTLKFKDSHSRDYFITVMGHWREACAFGFI